MSTHRPVAPEPSQADERRLLGRTILGRYTIERVLGVGGKGTVYDARDTTMDRSVAIKVPTVPNQDTIKRFLREGRAGASVAHPNVCAIYDFGPLEDATPFLVMERLVGETLGDRLERARKLALAEAIRVLQQVLSGLAAAHVQGIVHRDIKPGNIFLATEGRDVVAKILDFGASTLDPDHAKKEEDFEALTKIGTAIGTPTYMAPEQVRGFRDLDGRVDVYACGVLLYESVTGLRPFEAEKRAELFRRILKGEYPPVCAIDPSLPAALDSVLARAMAMRREDRYPSAVAFGNALESLQKESLRLSLPTPLVVTPMATERLGPLKQRLEQVSSLYLAPDSRSGLRLSRKTNTSVEIPVHVDEEAPETHRDGSPFDEDEDGPTRRDPWPR